MNGLINKTQYFRNVTYSCPIHTLNEKEWFDNCNCYPIVFGM